MLISFHVGRGASNTDVYRGTIDTARRVFDAAIALGMPPMRMVDIGGGVHGRPCVRRCGRGNQRGARPGRYLAGTAFTMAARVIGKHVRRGARLLD
ncbi:ornithine decarboxylase-like [Lolium perenne]|jgi:ornithine decarboxylase|uniref:ornithine decarboxylase-like n=1 Tax=Lolium perenne TaxID=4522 RepID=UPI003A999C5D